MTSDGVSDERATEERTADDVGSVPSQLVREPAAKVVEPAGIGEQPIEVEPRIAVVTGFVREVAITAELVEHSCHFDTRGLLRAAGTVAL